MTSVSVAYKLYYYRFNLSTVVCQLDFKFIKKGYISFLTYVAHVLRLVTPGFTWPLLPNLARSSCNQISHDKLPGYLNSTFV